MGNEFYLNDGVIAAILAFFAAYMLVIFGIGLLMIISMWRIYKKAGFAGWKSIIPIYNTYILMKIVKLPLWYFLLLFIPLVNAIISIVMTVKLAKVFGKDVLFGLVIIFFPYIGYPILAFGKARYEDDYNNLESDYQSPGNSAPIYDGPLPTQPVAPVQATMSNDHYYQQLVSQPETTNTPSNVIPPTSQSNSVFEPAAPVQPTYQPQSEFIAPEPVVEQPKVESKYMSCPNCGTNNIAGTNHCFLCGTKLN